jgi:hypothetical protein
MGDTRSTSTNILYLDFDGVLHPTEPHRPVHTLFESCEVLESLLKPYPDVSIVLSTSWVRAHSFDFAKAQLTPDLSSRVIGATWHTRHLHASQFDNLSRYLQIRRDVDLRGPERWLALDDDAEGWDPIDESRLARMPAGFGLSDLAAQSHLRERLATQFGNHSP